ncbi:MAG: hypothetical protein SFV15_24545 [Polyangiaceae bacterium]|nr:hypothetical protein [Polyangiaceae bacterium]
MVTRLKFLLGSGFAVTFAVAAVPACSDDTSTRPLGGGPGTTGGTSSGSGGAMGASGGNKVASGTGGVSNAASGGNKASGGTPNITPAAGGSKATGGTSNVGSGGANNNNNTGGKASTGGASNASGGASSGTGGGGSGGPAVGSGMVNCPAPTGMSDCATFCNMAWADAGCTGEATANVNCATECPKFTQDQFCCRIRAIDPDNSPLGDISGSLRGEACKWAAGLGCNMEIPAAEGDPAIPAMPAACGPAVAPIDPMYTSCPE